MWSVSRGDHDVGGLQLGAKAVEAHAAAVEVRGEGAGRANGPVRHDELRQPAGQQGPRRSLGCLAGTDQDRPDIVFGARKTRTVR